MAGEAKRLKEHKDRKSVPIEKLPWWYSITLSPHQFLFVFSLLFSVPKPWHHKLPVLLVVLHPLESRQQVSFGNLQEEGYGEHIILFGVILIDIVCAV